MATTRIYYAALDTINRVSFRIYYGSFSALSAANAKINIYYAEFNSFPNQLPAGTTRIIAVGDMDVSSGVTTQHIRNVYYADPQTTLALIGGDLVYPGSQYSQWSGFGLDTEVMRNGSQWIYPTTGHHEWGDSGVGGMTGATIHSPADGHDLYFASKGATQYGAGKWFYAHDLPDARWRIIHLSGTTNDGANIITGAGLPLVDNTRASEQYDWFQAQLQGAVDLGLNVLAIWSDPYLATTDDHHASEPLMQPFWQLLNSYRPGASIALTSHKHNYERFDAINAEGVVVTDPAVIEFVVGMGGQSHYAFTGAAANGSVVRNAADYGLLELTLSATSAKYKFIRSTDLAVMDSGVIPVTGSVVAAIPKVDIFYAEFNTQSTFNPPDTYQALGGSWSTTQTYVARSGAWV